MISTPFLTLSISSLKMFLSRLCFCNLFVLILFCSNLSFSSETLKPQWQPGTNYIYQIKLNDQVNNSLLGLSEVKNVNNSSALNLLQVSADLIMHCYSYSEDKGYRFGIRFANIRNLNVQFQGETLVGNGQVEALLSNARELLVDYDTNGRLLNIRHFIDQDPLLTRIIAVVVGEMQTALPENKQTTKTWQTTEVDYIGEGIAHYTISQRQDGISFIDKKKHDYQQIYTIPEGNFDTIVTADYQIEFNDKGYLSKLIGNKKLSAEKKGSLTLSVNTEFNAKLIKITEDKDLKFHENSTLVDYDYKMVKQTEQAKLNSLRKSAANLNPVTFFSWAEQYTHPDPASGNARETFMMKARMASQVELHPTLTLSFEEKILSDTINTEIKRMLLSVLVNAGIKEAQSSIVRVLSDKKIKALPDYYSLLQVSTFLQKPVTPQLINFYTDTMEKDKDQNVRIAAMYTVGALIRNLKDNRQLERAHKYNTRLIAQLNDKKPYEEQYALMFAIRNTRIAENFNVVKPYLKSDSELVRRGAVRAIGKYQTSEATYVLLDTLSDKSTNVKNGVIQSLMEHKLVRSDLVVIKEKVVDGDLDQRMDVTLIGLTMKYAKKYPKTVTQILEAVQDRGLGNKETEYKVNALLKAISRLQNFNQFQ